MRKSHLYYLKVSARVGRIRYFVTPKLKYMLYKGDKKNAGGSVIKNKLLKVFIVCGLFLYWQEIAECFD